MRKCLNLLVVAVMMNLSQSSVALEIVRDGAARVVVVLPAEPETAEQQAADELVEHIALISGVTLAVVQKGSEPAGLAPLQLGMAADTQLEASIRAKGDDPWAFALFVNDKGAQLRGLSPEGTRCAAYELLEQLGVRWFMPGETGRVVPSAKTLLLDSQETIQVPSFRYRRGPSQGLPKIWGERLRMPGVGRRYGAHGIAPLKGKASTTYFNEDPRLFALVDGKRKRRQLCLTYSTHEITKNRTLSIVAEHYRQLLRKNPAMHVLHMGPNDGGGFCQCDACRKLDPPGDQTVPLMTPGPSYTDRYVWFFNQLATLLRDEFPEVRIGFYAYAGLQMPPLKVEPQDNLAISLAPIHTCRIHGPHNPICPESNFPLWLLEAWRPYVGNYIADRGYLFNLACPGFPFSMVHRVREEIPAFHDRGVRIWSADPSSAWASHNPTMYIAAKLLWNHTADVDALLQEFYDLYYGPAAEPMAAYHTLMDATIRDADYHTGGSWDMPLIYPAEVRAQARAFLHQAEELTEKDQASIYATRVEITRLSLDFLDQYCLLMTQRNQHDFKNEMKSLSELEAIRDKLLNDFEYPMLHARHANRLLSRFIRRMSEANFKTLADGGEIVAPLSHQWQFQLDPQGWGRYLGLHQAESAGGNWQTIRSDLSWSNQGLRYYFGDAWYRQVVALPDNAQGKKICLWFAGVDRTAEVWVNGRFAGANHGGAEFDLDAYGSSFKAFEFEVTDLIQSGTTNIVTLRVSRPGTAEIGTGGIVGPAMFYSPGKQ